MTKRKSTSTSVASASQGKPKRQKPVINDSAVATYLTLLEAALGDDRTFPPLFERLKADEAMQQADMVALATRFVAKTSDSTSRAKALERIWKRHASLVSFKLKQRAMAGRSAA